MHAVAAGRAALWNENAERSLLPMNGSAGYLELLSCPERRLAFTHVYKAAGSYVDERVCSACPRATCYLPCPPERLANCNCGYLDTAGAGTRTCRVGRKATLRRSHLGANPGMEAASGVRLFTVVRHPVQRFVSAASQLKSLGLLAANASCADTLRTVELRGPFDAHLRPQTAFMVDGRGEPLRFEWIFTVEELANVTRLLGMEPAVEDALRVHSLPRGNGFHCRAAERRRIEQLYEVDYRAFRLAGVRFRWAS
mmetsp:Transcript_33029/g.109117  ORF Transcript_33029/g.109117 Transcript_33029/m.109117 type:complete len:254 (-) Transcript_33029:113-874(-)